MYYPEDVVEQVRSANNIVDVIGSYVKLNKKGNSYFGLCPFHNEKTASFSVSPDKQMYYCFGCGAGGNVFTFLMEYENFSFSEALTYLAERAGITLPEPENSSEARREADLRQKIFEVNKEAARYYVALLYNERGKNGLKYFQNRGLSPETMKSFGLGYADKYTDDLYKYLKKKGYPDEILRESGLFVYNEKNGMQDKFWNRVMFPIMDANHKVIAFGGRVLGDAKPKYLNSPETKIFDKSRNLYGLHVARREKSRKLILCEGYMDVIACHQAGFTNAVASLGTAFTTGQAQLIRRYADSVYLVYDSDGAGTRAILRALPILRDAGIDGHVVRLTPYKDPDEFISHMGKEAFQQRLDEAENGFLFRIRVLEEDYDMKTPEGRTRFFRKVAEELLIFEDNIERNSYIQAISDRYLIQSADLRMLVNKAAMKGTPKPSVTETSETAPIRKKWKPDDAALEAQRLLLTWMVEFPELGKTIRRYIFPTDFTTPLYRESAKLLYEQEEAGDVRPAAIISHFTDEADQKEVAALFNAKLTVRGDAEAERRAIREAIIRVKRASIERMSSELDPTDMQSMQELITSKMALQKLEKLNLGFQ